MRLSAVVCAILVAALPASAGAQIYPYLATLPIAQLKDYTQSLDTAPQGVAYDTIGNRLLVAEGSNQVIELFDGGSLALLSTLGAGGAAGSDAGHFSAPGGVAFDPTHNRILVADTGNHRVQVFDAGSLALVATLGVTGVAGSDNAHFSSPSGVAIDTANDHFVVADTGNDRVQLFDAASLALLGTIGVSGSAGADNGHLSGPLAVACDPVAQHVLVADTGNNRVQVFNAQTASYVATIGGIGGAAGVGVDVAGRRIFASAPASNIVMLIDADALVPASGLGLIGSFGPDNARFLGPTGIAADPATGRVFIGDDFLADTPQPGSSRVQIFGQPSPLFAAVAPGGRAVAVGEIASIFATVLNTGTIDLANCRVGLPNDAPASVALTYQTTNPSTNKQTGQPNQPVTIPANQGQSFILSLTATAPATALGESFLFLCDGVTPAPVFSGINTADITFSASPTADVIVAAATPGGTGSLVVPNPGSNSEVSFPVAAYNLGAAALVEVSTDSGTFYPVTGDGLVPGYQQTLPISVLVCQTNLLTGQCQQSPTSTLSVGFSSGATATFTVFIAQTTSAIPQSILEPRLFLRFTQANGGAVPTSVGNASVAVTTTVDSQE
jgi:DNA-binding beta-propeller fold protein YncE